MICIDNSHPLTAGTSNRNDRLRSSGTGNRYVLSLAAIHEDARSWLAALQVEAQRWRRRHGRPRSNAARAQASFGAYVEPPESAQQACRFLLCEGRYLIGRSGSSDLQFDCPSVSRRHAELVVLSTRGVLVRDLGSVNGTRVDGVLITEAAIDGEAILDLGPLRLNLTPDEPFTP